MKRLAIVAATVLLTACAGKSRVAEPNVVSLAKLTPDAAKMERAELANLSGAELRVRLNQDLGPGISTVNGTFSARLTSPIVGTRGRVLVPVGALVHGHVVHVDEANRRVEIAFDRLETRTASYWMRATVVTAAPFAVTVRPEGTSSANESVVLQGTAPSAIGGGPRAPESEADESAPRVDAIVPFDAELRLKLTAPVGKS